MSTSESTTRRVGNMTLRLPSDLEIELTRTFDAPLRLVWEAYSKPEHVRRWWGRKDDAMPVCELDFRSGGHWRFVTVGPDGVEHAFRGEIREVVPMQRIVQTFEYEGYPGHVSVETATFAEHDGKTIVTARSLFESKEERDAMIATGMEGGANESYDRLAELLATIDREIVQTRLIDAPRERVFRMWTDPAHVARWWGPNGFTTTIDEMDVRPGGRWRFVMHGPDGTDYRNEHVYVEVAPPEILVMDHVTGPLFRLTASFAERGPATEVTVRMAFASAALRDQVATEGGALEGLKQTLARLEAATLVAA